MIQALTYKLPLIILVFAFTGGICCAAGIGSGETLPGVIGNAGEQNSYTFAAVSGDTVQCRMTGLADSDVWPDIELRSPDGTLLAGGSSTPHNSAEVTHSLSNSGTFTLICKSTTINTGAYRVAYLRMPGYPLSSTDSDIGAIAHGATHTGAIDSPGDLDACTFAAVSGDTVQCRMTGLAISDVWPDIELRSPDGTLLAGGSSTPHNSAEVTHSLSNSGTFTLICKSTTINTGAYRVAYLRMPGYPLSSTDSDIGAIAHGATHTGAIDSPGDLDACTFAAVSGDTVQCRMTGLADSDVWPDIELRSPDGTLLAGGSSTPHNSAEVTHSLSNNGIFTLICKSTTIDVGSYHAGVLLMGGHTSHDIDGDGVSNVDELKAWTDPFDPDCFLGIYTVTQEEDGTTLKWQTIGGMRYRVHYTDDLANRPWADITRPEAEEIESDVAEGDGHWQEFTDKSEPPQGDPDGNSRFYCIGIVR